MQINYDRSKDEENLITKLIIEEIKNPSPIHNNQQVFSMVSPRLNKNGSLDIACIMIDAEYPDRIYVFCKDNDKYTYEDGNYNIVFVYNEVDKNIRVLVRPKTYVRLTIFSDELSYEEMKSFTKLQTSGGWSKGDKTIHGKTFHEISHMNIECDFAKMPGLVNENIIRMLNYMDKDKEGLMKLSKNSEIGFCINSRQHYFYTHGLHLSKEMMERLTEYKCEIDYDFGIYGLPENLCN